VSVLDQIIAKYDSKTKFMWGHANEGYDVIGGKEEIKAFQNYLTQLLVLGRKSIASGISLEDLKKTVKIVPGAEQWTGSGIDRSLDAIYQELQ
jgi:hypothetical protein